MRKFYLSITFVIIICMLSKPFLYAQKKDSTWIGAVSGTIKDSSLNFVLQLATVAVYQDSILLNYQLTNNYGRFAFKQLPIGKRLRIIASYIGYKNGVQEFEISNADKELKLPPLNLLRSTEDSLPDVIVKTVPPVQMNGDTLEFNADAFKLDKNAVVEDLLKQLPGVTVWGDGAITVNGHEVSSLKVNGKPFMGGDSKIATRNLSKTIVDKVQVYQQNRNSNNPFDSTTEINIKLKQGKDNGYFGKLSSGKGSDRRYEAVANLNHFNAHTQLGLVGDANNVNKVAKDAEELIRNSTFKGVGASIEYQPDFRMEGINTIRSAGFTFQQDFIDNPTLSSNNRLKANYYIQKRNANKQNLVKSLHFIDDRNSQTQTDVHNDNFISTNQSFFTNYNKHFDKNTFNSSISFYDNKNVSNNYQQSSILDVADELQSTNLIQSNLDNHSNTISLNTAWSHRGNIDPSFFKGNVAKNYDIDYIFSASSDKNNSDQLTSFVSLSDPGQNQLIDRKYNNQSNLITHQIDAKLNSLTPWFFGTNGFLSSVLIELTNSLKINKEEVKNKIYDLDTVLSVYTTNNYLSTNSNSITVYDIPALNLSKKFYHSLANRYDKGLGIAVSLKEQIYYQKNRSNHNFQNFSRNYHHFIPSFSLTYNNDQFGAYKNIYALDFLETVGYPSVNQMYPLVDSSNLYYLVLGNSQLKPYRKKNIAVSYEHTSFVSKNPFNYKILGNLGLIDNALSDSSIVDKLGRTSHYTVNADGYKYIDVKGELNKAYKFNNNQLQLRLSSSYRISWTPNSVNSIWNFSRASTNENFLNVYYTISDYLSIEASQSYLDFRSIQNFDNKNIFKNRNSITSFSVSGNITNKFNVGSNINYNSTKFSGSNAINYTIWNASVAYRLLPGNNLEFKFSALDLLHQNTSVRNYGDANSISQSISNVLQQYFILSVSFYPRQFGRLQKGKDNNNL